MNAINDITGLSSPLIEQLEKRLAFSDQSESGYSTATSSDELRRFKSKMNFENSVPISRTGYIYSPKNLEPHFSNLQQMKIGRPTRFESESAQHTLTISPIRSSSQTYPVYYDPLHLQNVSPHDIIHSNEKQPINGGDGKAYAFHNIRGILKTNSHLTGDQSGKFSKQISPTLSSQSSKSTPTCSVDRDQSLSLFSQDPQRVSAFTPVKSRRTKNENSNNISPDKFSPSKGPNILDCVNSVHSNLNSLDPLSSSKITLHHNLRRSKEQKNENCKNFTDQKINNTKTVFYPIPGNRTMKIAEDIKSLKAEPIQDSSFSEHTASNDSLTEKLSNEALRLRKFLDNAIGKDLKKYLCNQLDSNNPEIIKALAILIPESMTQEMEGHCARCHKSFILGEKRRCFLPHPESMVEKINQDEEGADFICHCCSTAFRLYKMNFYEENTNAVLTGHCYSGQHTTDPECVDYRDQGGAAKTCRDNGCVEFYV